MSGIDLYGFQNATGSAFTVNGNYSGGSYLYYDGHPGYDFRTTDQSPDGKIDVLAAATGTVFLLSSSNGIRIDHGNGYYTNYYHLSERDVSAGQIVQRGEKIGVSGDVGAPGSPHLHFSVQLLVGSDLVPVDPYGWQGTGADPYTAATDVNLWGTPVSPGVTLITHGGWPLSQGDSKGWVTAMASAIKDQLPDPTNTSIWTLTVTDDTIPYVGGAPQVTGVSWTGPNRFTQSYNGQSIIELDWSLVQKSSLNQPLGDSTTQVAAAVADYLLATRIAGKTWLDVPLHLIGHSRGASLVAALAKDLGEAGVWVDKVTYLDPYPIDGDYGFSGSDTFPSGSPIMSRSPTTTYTVSLIRPTRSRRSAIC